MKTYKIDFKGLLEGKEITINYGIYASHFYEATKEASRIQENIMRFWGDKLSSLELVKIALKEGAK